MTQKKQLKKMKKVKILLAAMAISVIAVTSIKAQTPVCSSENNDSFEVTNDRTGDGYSYEWSIAPAGPTLSASNGITTTINWTTGTVGTTYTLSLKESIPSDNGGDCESTVILEKVIVEAPTVSIATDQVICNGDNLASAVVITLDSGESSDWSFTWNDGTDHAVNSHSGGTFTIPGYDAGDAAPGSTTTITVSDISDVNGCGVTAGGSSVTITVPDFSGLGITDNP